MLSSIRPYWFTSVMGTGIVANAAALLPFSTPALTAVALAFWTLAALLLIILAALAAGQLIRHPRTALSHHRELGTAPFYGAMSMALLTVGSGALLAGRHLIGREAAVWVDTILWTAGTVSGLACAITIPYLLFTRHRPTLADVHATWLMAIVPPMVAASCGAGLIPHLSAGQPRITLLFGCYAMFGLSLAMAMIVIALVWARLALHGVGEARMAPTVWIVLGPLGQSITAVCLLAHVATGAVSAHTAAALRGFALVDGTATWGFAIAWLAVCIAITIRTARDHLPFAPTWWSFTFPLGTVATGTAELSVVTGIGALRVIAAVLGAGLFVAWLTVASRTALTVIQARRVGRVPRPTVSV